MRWFTHMMKMPVFFPYKTRHELCDFMFADFGYCRNMIKIAELADEKDKDSLACNTLDLRLISNWESMPMGLLGPEFHSRFPIPSCPFSKVTTLERGRVAPTCTERIRSDRLTGLFFFLGHSSPLVFSETHSFSFYV